MFDPENFEDEQCDDCGASPSVSMGHGRMICKACYEAMWCPKCKYSVHCDLVDGVHACLPADVLAKRAEEHEDALGVILDPDEYVGKLRAEINSLKARLANCTCSMA